MALEQAVEVLAALRLARVQAQEVAVAQLPVAAEAMVPRPAEGAAEPVAAVAAVAAVAVAVAEPLLSAVQLWRLQPGRPAQRALVAGVLLLPWLVLRQAPHS